MIGDKVDDEVYSPISLLIGSPSQRGFAGVGPGQFHVSMAPKCLPPHLPPLLNIFLSSLLLYADKRVLESCEPNLYQFGSRALMWAARANP
jgi:hypothetical protein